MVRGGLVGCGQVVEEMHMPAWRAIPEVQLEAVYDQNPQQLRSFAGRYGFQKMHSSLEDLLDRHPHLDFLSIATPGFTHYELCRAAIEAGVAVLVEKPLALSLEEVLDLKARAQRNKVKVCVGHTYRFRDPVLIAKEACERGLVGKILQFNVVHHGGPLFHASEPSWRWQERRHKVLLYELAVNLLDLQVYFAGPVERLLGWKTLCDPSFDATTHLYALAEHREGAIGLVDFQAFASSCFTHLEIYGTANDVQIKFFPHSYRLYSGRLNPLDELITEFFRIQNFLLASLRDTVARGGVSRRSLPHWRLFRRFVDSLENESMPVPVSIESVLPTMEFLEELGTRVYSGDHPVSLSAL